MIKKIIIDDSRSNLLLKSDNKSKDWASISCLNLYNKEKNSLSLYNSSIRIKQEWRKMINMTEMR
jgi:hypothetical protein